MFLHGVFMRCAASLLTAIFLLGMVAPPAWAQRKYPTRPITLIVPWAAGGGTDRISRMVASLLEQDLGVPVMVVNRTGGGGAVGHTAGATAPRNGYTITMVTSELTLIHWLGLARVTYRDYKPVALLNLDPAGISVSVDSPWKTYRDLHNAIKKNPGKLTASGTGPGGIWDLARAGWLQAAGFDVNAVRWIPSRGAAPALAEVAAGGVDICTCSLVEAAPLISAGKIRPLATMAERREKLFPDVPTLKELGIDWTVGAWRGIAVPKGTPKFIVETLEGALKKAVQSKAFIDFMRTNGFGIIWKPAAEFATFLAEEDKVNGELLRKVGLAR